VGDSTSDRGHQIIPLPEPARRGLINTATEVAAATNQAVAGAAHIKPTEPAPRAGIDGGRRVGRAAHEPRNSGPSSEPRRPTTMSPTTSAAKWRRNHGGTARVAPGPRESPRGSSPDLPPPGPGAALALPKSPNV
jgi:hypothetical protein